MDFYSIKEHPGEGKNTGKVDVYVDYKVTRSKDLMIRGKAFYAMWNPETGLWSMDEYDVQRLVDKELREYEPEPGKYIEVHKKYLGNFSTKAWMVFRQYVQNVSDSYHQLDENLTFADQEVRKEDYVSRRLPYSLKTGDISAWDELVGTLYSPSERAKIEWAIGAIVSGDSKTIQKFLVFYGAGGTGKSTIMNIIVKLFEGYVSYFDAKALVSNGNSFATDVFRSNPLVVIQQDGDMSKVEDNSRFNSIISHEYITMNEKFKASYEAKVNAMAIIGSNKAVKISDAKSGLIRRLIDVRPTGDTISPKRYQTLVAQIDFELGAIADYCLSVYQQMGKNYYAAYRPTEMMLQTDVFYNFIEAYFDTFNSQEGTTLSQAYALYKEFTKETNLEYTMPQYRFREELKNYFGKFDDRMELADGTRVRSYFSDFNADRFKIQVKEDEMAMSLVLDETESLLDVRYENSPAQYTNKDGNPILYWDDSEREIRGVVRRPEAKEIVSTTLSDLNTHREHYINIEDEHEIVIDFDLTDEHGKKSLQLNLEAASQWPPTYAEYSKSGEGIHLHYYYDGDVDELSRIYEPGIEIKVFKGNSSLRRKLTKCNNIPVATISGGLPKKEKKMANPEGIQDEKHLRALIEKNLRKEILPGTKPSIDFIYKILDDVYSSGMQYDVTDMRGKLMAFANNSSNQALYCMKMVKNMKFASEERADILIEPEEAPATDKEDADYAFFDVEVFPNLFVVCWKTPGGKNTVRMINPSQKEIEELLKLRLIGFNNRKYDNHILYAAFLGYSVPQLYQLSQKIISKSPNAFFGEAYNISYTDIYDFASAENKHSLKWFQIELGLNHQELGLPWDQPVPEELWDKVAEYCANDVETTEVVFNHLEGDFTARRILAAISGLSVNEMTNKHSTRIMFGDERHPQDEFKYTKLSEMFPGYKFELGKSFYREEDPGEGGYVHGEPGIYYDVAVLDVASMHPTSIEQLNLFGGYTKRFSEIKEARVMIKRKNFDGARKAMDGILAPFLEKEENAKGLSNALKTIINSVYGLTSAKFENHFRDPRNVDNIVAKRGALFMIDLKHAVQELGYSAVHIKTDSIKIPNADEKIIQFVMEFGAKYGYEFEHEKTYSRMALVNDAVFIAQVGWSADGDDEVGKWTATGAQFQHPYVFKTLFSKEPVEFADLCEAKYVQTALYLDFTNADEAMVWGTKGMHFVGKAGSFCPILPGKGGAQLVREKDGKFYSATGAKGYFWLEAPMVKEMGKEEDIDMSYFNKLTDKAIATISQFGDFEEFVK